MKIQKLYIIFVLVSFISISYLLLANKEVSKSSSYLLILGTAQDGGSPQAGCQKECCKDLWNNSENRKMVSCIGIIDPATKQQWIIDATPDFKWQIARLNAKSGQKELSGIFLTHAHIGHYTGLMDLGREVMGAKSLKVYAMPRMQNFLEQNAPWSQLVNLKNISIHSLKADSAILLSKNIKIIPFLVPHRDEFSETVGYKIIGKNKSALFIPDIDKWQKWERSIIDEIKTFDYAFLDGTFYANGEIPGRDMSEIPHPFIEESINIFSELSEKEKSKIFFIHLNHTNPALKMESKAYKKIVDSGFNVAEELSEFGL